VLFLQLAGASYLDVHQAGGGIHFTVRHVHAASEHQLSTDLVRYARRMTQAGKHDIYLVVLAASIAESEM